MIARKTWREVRVMTLVYLGILELLLVPIVLLWPDFYGDLQKSSLLKSIPVDFAKRIAEGISGRDEDAAYLNWLALHLFFKGVNMVGLAAAVLLGTALFAREREAQTLEFLLARPIARWRVLLQKSWPVALCIVVPVFLANWSVIWWSRRIDIEVPFAEVTVCCLHGSLYVLMFLAFTTWVSVLCRVQAHVAFWVGGFTVVEIGVYLIPRWRHTSIFRLSDYDLYAPVMAGNVRLGQLLDPIGGSGQTFWVVVATVVLYALALRALRRLEL